ncbi:hypothetical protein AMK10_35345 [Streptomyces sp. CB02058]|nr:hypothetical protein AMK10_35345 [Streptomyces sp. CB02058]
MATDVQDSFYRRIDAVLRSKDEGHIAWIFKDRNYIRYDLKADQGVSGPREIAGNWPGLQDSFTRSVDAALNRRDQPAVGYLFKDDQYVRYDLESNTVPPGYPKAIADGWTALPAPFQLGIDAAVNHPTDPQVVWLLKDDQYVGYNVASDKLLGGPKPIRGNWGGPAGLLHPPHRRRRAPRHRPYQGLPVQGRPVRPLRPRRRPNRRRLPQAHPRQLALLQLNRARPAACAASPACAERA